MSLTSDELNYLVYRYLLESGTSPNASKAHACLCHVEVLQYQVAVIGMGSWMHVCM